MCLSNTWSVQENNILCAVYKPEGHEIVYDLPIDRRLEGEIDLIQCFSEGKAGIVQPCLNLP
jgi:hypothetical protein